MKPQLWAEPFRCLHAQLTSGLWPNVTLCCLCQSGRTQWLQQGLQVCPWRPHLPAALMTLPGTTVHSGAQLCAAHDPHVLANRKTTSCLQRECTCYLIITHICCWTGVSCF